VADQLLELFLIGQRLLQLGKQVDELVQELCLLAGFEPDSHCVVHDDDRDNYADGEWERVQPIDNSRRGRHGADRGRMAARHTAVAENARQVQRMVHERVNDRLQNLCRAPANEAAEQHAVGE